jgi:hypothetical protein
VRPVLVIELYWRTENYRLPVWGRLKWDIRAIQKHIPVHKHDKKEENCAADFSLLNLPKGKSLGRSKPATNS